MIRLSILLISIASTVAALAPSMRPSSTDATTNDGQTFSEAREERRQKRAEALAEHQRRGELIREKTQRERDRLDGEFLFEVLIAVDSYNLTIATEDDEIEAIKRYKERSDVAEIKHDLLSADLDAALESWKAKNDQELGTALKAADTSFKQAVRNLKL